MESLIFNRRVSFMTYATDGMDQYEKVDDWLEKWEGQYRVIDEDAPHHGDFVHDMNLECTEDAYHALPDYGLVQTDWSTGAMNEEEYRRFLKLEPRKKA